MSAPHTTDEAVRLAARIEAFRELVRAERTFTGYLRETDLDPHHARTASALLQVNLCAGAFALQLEHVLPVLPDRLHLDLSPVLARRPEIPEPVADGLDERDRVEAVGDTLAFAVEFGAWAAEVLRVVRTGLGLDR